MPTIDSVPTTSTTVTSDRICGTSYEMSWPADRSPPMSEYLLFEAQPAMTKRSGAQMTGSMPNGPTGTASSAPAGVAAWRKERLPHRVTGERFFEEDAAEIGVAVKDDPEHVVGLALAPVRAAPHRGERGH